MTAKSLLDRALTFDPAPVLAQIDLVLGERGAPVTDTNCAALLGVDPRSVRAWRKGRTLCPWTADRVAIALGLHPGLLWHDWFTGPTGPTGSSIDVTDGFEQPPIERSLGPSVVRRANPANSERVQPPAVTGTTGPGRGTPFPSSPRTTAPRQAR